MEAPDSSDWRRGEERWLQTHLSSLLNVTRDAVISLDGADRIRFFNGGAERLFRHSSEDAITQPINSILSIPVNWKRKIPGADPFSTAEADVCSIDLEVMQAKRKDGIDIGVAGAVVPVKINGEIIHVFMLREAAESDGTESIGANSGGAAPNGEYSALAERNDHRTPGSLKRGVISRILKIHEVRDIIEYGLSELGRNRLGDSMNHLRRIQRYTRLLAEDLSAHPQYRGYIDDEYLEDISWSCIFYDIGKSAIPDRILFKNGWLDGFEFEHVKRHVLKGGETIDNAERSLPSVSFLSMAKQIAYYHHERWDGTGYMTGLRGEDIPLSARIVALADFYDALTVPRPYKEPIAHAHTKTIIQCESGHHFDPAVVESFLRLEDEFERVTKGFQDQNGRDSASKSSALLSGVMGIPR